MIFALTGKLGHGKTYHAVKFAMGALKRNHVVVSNIDFKIDAVFESLKRDGYDVPRENLSILNMALAITDQLPLRRDPAVWCIIDEAHLWFNSRDWKSGEYNRKLLLNFLTLSRKYAVNFMFITQHFERIDVQIRQLVEKRFRCYDLSQFAIPVIGGRLDIPLSLVTEFDNTTEMFMGHTFLWRDKKIFQLYDSYSIDSQLNMFKNDIRLPTSVRINKAQFWRKKLLGF